MGSWVVVESKKISTFFGDRDIYLTIKTTSGTIVEATMKAISSTGKLNIFIESSIYLPEGTKVRARYSGFINEQRKSVTTNTLTAGTFAQDEVKLGRALASYDGDNISGTLYIEKYEPTPPSTPSSISVPTTVKGGESIVISWGSSSGATRYHLERRVNGGTWTQIYQGSNRSYTDTITKGWKTVAYRVRAYNSDGYSDYRTSPTRTVINFPEMQIKINGVLKTSDAGWVRVNGQLREIDTIWVKINGAIKEVQ